MNSRARMQLDQDSTQPWVKRVMPHKLGRRRHPRRGPGVRQVVLHGRVREAETVSGRVL
jgi:hypothetical protein